MNKFWIIFFLAGLPFHVSGQYDSSYIAEYDGYLVGRLLINRKYTGLNVRNDVGNYNVRYRPNKTFSVGAGVTYKFATLNLSVGVIQPSEDKGRTRHLDLQLHKIGRRSVTDLLFQFYKGFYIPQGRYAQGSAEYYLRPDISVDAIGIAHQYIFNHRKFSYRAAFQQTELQKRSAGSFTAGVELFMGRFAGDSTVFPSQLTSQESMYKMKFIEIGPSVGYIHTWVYKKLFFTAGGAVSLNFGINKFYERETETTYPGFSPNSVIRLSTGYNVGKWSFNLLFLSRALHLPDFENRSVLFNTGNIRMNLVYRFRPGRATKKLLREIDKIDERFKG